MLERVTRRIENKYLYYFLTFFGNLTIYSLPLAYPHYKHVEIYALNKAYAKLVYMVLSRFYDGFLLEENSIVYGNLRFIINTECIGYKSFFGMFALTMATPVLDIKRRLKWALIFSTTMLLINFVRVLSVIILGYQGYDVFIVHNVLWQILNNVIALVFWLFFLFKIGNIKLNKKFLFSGS